MSTYISSNQNRFYCGIEASYGITPSITATNRFSAVKLSARQELNLGARKDKTGSRTFPGAPAGARRKTSFETKTYLALWPTGLTHPGCGPLTQCALGAAPVTSSGGTVASVTSGTELTFSAPHGLVPNQAVSFDGEIRFVSSVLDASNVVLNAPFTTQPTAGSELSRTITYFPATTLPSASLFDYWSPSTAVQRILTGVAVDKMSISLNSDYHEFDFKGYAKDLVDSSSFSSGDGGLNAYPAEPALANFDYTIVPGNLGQAWIGASPQQFQTITAASLQLNNHLSERDREFGSSTPLAVSPGPRSVYLDLSLFEKDDTATIGLYQAARQRSPITIMLQMGQATGQLCGVYLKSVVPELPEFDDTDTRLQWRFNKSQAQGTTDDEIVVAFA
jgi:hypothetical protein